MGKLFGTDGIRGVANADLTPELAFRIGRASASHLARRVSHPRIVVGKDTRISGDMLEGAFAVGVCSVGGDVLKVGVMPTPGVAFLTLRLNAQAGVMISASHNPIEDNGIKLFSEEGFKLPDEEEEKIEELVLDPEDSLSRPTGEELGRVIEIKHAEDLYAEYVKQKAECSLSGLRVVLDCAYGATYRLASRVFRELGAEVLILHDQPNGININLHCGSTNPAVLQKVVLADGAHAGLAFDGDGDRCLAVDERGRIVDGDQMMTIFTAHLLKYGKMGKKPVVATVMSNLGFELALREMGVGLIRTKVGDRYVLEEMRRQGAILGGEQSGHIIFLEHNTTGDGLLTGTQLLCILKQNGIPLSELAGKMKKMPQLLINVKARFKERLAEDEDICRSIAEMENLLQDRGRLLVRASGTEPLVRVMAEGPDEKELQKVVGQLARLIEEKLG